MKVSELIKQLEKYKEMDPYIYLNYETNWEDNFQVRFADTGNVLLIPNAKYKQLSEEQEFYFVED